MSTLLEKAKAVQTTRKLPTSAIGSLEERLDLALAYMRRELTVKQVSAATGWSQTAIHNRCGSTILTAIRAGLLRVEKVKK